MADQFLNKGKIVDAFYGETPPPRDENFSQSTELLNPLKQLAACTSNNLPDNPPFYFKSIFCGQIEALKQHLETCLGSQSFWQTGERISGIALASPDIEIWQHKLAGSLKKAGYSGDIADDLREWRDLGNIDVFAFMDLVREGISALWEQVRGTFLNNLITEEEIDLLEKRSQIKLAYQNNLWDDQPFYGGYRGNYLSMYCFNARLLWNRFAVKTFMLYELLPGRHLFWLLRQRLNELQELPAMSLLSTCAGPEKLVQEGLIACSPEFVMPGGFTDPQDQIAWDYQRLQNAVGYAATLKFWEQPESVRETREFIRREACLSSGRTDALMKTIRETPFYYPNIFAGYQFIKKLWLLYPDQFQQEFIRYRSPELLQRLYPW